MFLFFYLPDSEHTFLKEEQENIDSPMDGKGVRWCFGDFAVFSCVFDTPVVLAHKFCSKNQTACHKMRCLHHCIYVVIHKENL